MSRRSLTLLAGSVLALAASYSAHADEGMWMPQQLPQLAPKLKAAGLKSDPATLSRLTEFPMGAIVGLPGCTGSFVSAQGLVVTNHHCAYGSIQFNSTPQRDLLKNGFLAPSFADELPAAPGTRVYVTVAVTDVSAQVVDAKTDALQGKARVDAIEAKQKSLVAECEKDAGHRCNVYSFYGGLQYQLIKQMEIRDVRLVHAPAEGVGLFGGDTDNWMWPRHTGDYSFYRAYVGPDGKPADYDKANKPFTPAFHLKTTSTPLRANDFVMAAGYPGRTNRHRLPAEVDFTFSFAHPAVIKAYGERLDIIKAATAGRRDAEIKMADMVAGLNNTMKNYQGQQASYDGSDILARKQKTYAELKAWVAADAKRRTAYADSFAAIDQLLTERQAADRAEFLMPQATPRLLAAARQLHEWAQQQARPDEQRKPGYQQRDLRRIRAGMEALDRRYDEATDKAVVLHFLKQYLAQPAAQQNAVFLQALGVKPSMDEAALKARLDALYAGSQLGNTAARLAWFGKDAAAFNASDDAFIAAAVALYADDQRREDRDKEIAGRIQQAYAKTQQALIAFKASQGQAVYPDANSTLRVTYGTVTGRETGRDGESWKPFTTLEGILPKHTGTGEFDAPAEQRAAIKARRYDQYAAKELGTVPVNFLSTLDTTGGGSGSPVLNARAELVGLLFDGTLDAVISDTDFNPKTTRAIGLDARYMLWQMKVVDKAQRLLDEMGVK